MARMKVVGSVKQRILCYVNIFSENRAVCDIMLTDMVERGRPQVTILRVLISP